MQALTRALRKLGEVGYPDEASRIAARAYSAIRHEDPTNAERINGTMHYLARLPDPINAPQNHTAQIKTAQNHAPQNLTTQTNTPQTNTAQGLNESVNKQKEQ